MGIWGLRKHVLNPPIRVPDIAVMAKEFKIRTGSKTAVAVVDGSNILFTLTEQLNYKCGGSFRKLARRIKDMLNTFTDMGITTVWFFDGNDDDHRRKIWLKRKQNLQESIAALYAGVSNAKVIQPAGTFETLIITLKAEGVEVHMSKGDGDLDLARYARANKAFCILSADMDFVLLPGVNVVLSCAPYDMTGWRSTACFRQDRLVEKLRFSDTDDLALLGALLPNEFLSEDVIMEFYRCKSLPAASDLSVMGPAVIRYISDLASLTSKQAKVKHILKDLPHSVQEAIRKSISMFDYLRAVEEAARRLYDAEILPEVHMILSKRILEMSPALERPGVNAAGRTELALRPLRAKIYGILELRQSVREWYPSSDVGPIKPHDVHPIHPGELHDPEHPGLRSLWLGRTQRDEDARWELLGWALVADGQHGDYQRAARMLRELHSERLKAPAATLLALHQSGALAHLSGTPEQWVRKLALACGQCIHPDSPKKQAYPTSAETMHLAAVFMRVYTHIVILNDALGHPIDRKKMSPSLFFDGEVFQYVCSLPDCKLASLSTTSSSLLRGVGLLH